jgi:TrpR-related protein YerC/YecD
MEKNISTKAMKELFKTIAELENSEECKNFLRDLCTLSELTAMAERLQVAKAVQKNIPYREISKQTGASTATITRVAHWVHHGMGGYARVLSKE